MRYTHPHAWLACRCSQCGAAGVPVVACRFSLFDELSRLRATLSRMYEQQTSGFLVTTKLRAVAQGNALLCVLRRQRRTLLVRGMNALKYTSAAGQLSRNFNVLASAASILARRQFPHLTGSALVPCWKVRVVGWRGGEGGTLAWA